MTERYKLDDNGDYEWVVDPDTGCSMSPKKICDILNSLSDHAARPAFAKARNALSTLPAKPMGEDEIKRIITLELKAGLFKSEKVLCDDIIRALKAANALYVAEGE